MCVFRTVLAQALQTDLDLQNANFHMTEQRIVLGQPPESMKEMIVKTLVRDAPASFERVVAGSPYIIVFEL